MVTGRFILIDNNFSYNLYMGNNPLRSRPPDFRPDFLAHMNDFPGWFEGDGRALNEAAVEWLVKHPLEFLQRAPRKIGRLLSPGFAELGDFRREFGEIPAGALLFLLLSFVPESMLALFSCYFAPRLHTSGKERFLLLSILAVLAMHMLFFGMPRYRQPLLALFFFAVLLGSQRSPQRVWQKPLGAAFVISLVYLWLEEWRFSGWN